MKFQSGSWLLFLFSSWKWINKSHHLPHLCSSYSHCLYTSQTKQEPYSPIWESRFGVTDTAVKRINNISSYHHLVSRVWGYLGNIPQVWFCYNTPQQSYTISDDQLRCLLEKIRKWKDIWRSLCKCWIWVGLACCLPQRLQHRLTKWFL